MNIFKLTLFSIVFLSLNLFAQNHQDIQLKIDAENSFLEAKVTINLEAPGETVILYLNKNLTLTSPIPFKILKSTYRNAKAYSFPFSRGSQLELSYSGKIIEDPKDLDAGFIKADEVMLFTNSFWAPIVEETTMSFDLNVILNSQNWEALSQGELKERNVNESKTQLSWKIDSPQTDFYFLASRNFAKFTIRENDRDLSVLLRSQDQQLANQFLESTKSHLELFEKMIGPYPYSQFITVENTWETGYGMPSFTLLGPSVIRLPFIFNTSFAHEILHNWWGNGVFVNYQNGNWCEGLTTYMSDHYFQEISAQGMNYRRSTLQNYKNYVTNQNEFTLREFTSRNSNSSQAIGYGKSMMFFHMLKVLVGEKDFQKAMQDFYQQRLFKVSSYEDIQESFERTTGLNLKGIFKQWIDRKGIAELEIVQAKYDDSSKEINLVLKQKTKYPYILSLPIQLIDDRGNVVKEEVVTMRALEQDFSFETGFKTIKELRIDPNFDVFRLPHPQELPLAFSGVFGEKNKIYFIIPEENKNNYLSFVNQIKSSFQAQTLILNANAISHLPEDGNIWLLGDSKWNKLLKDNLALYDIKLKSNSLKIEGDQNYKNDDFSYAFTLNYKNNKQLTYLHLSPGANSSTLARKIPHYGKYSLIIFEQETNVKKSQWPVLSSPLIYKF